MGAHSPCTRSVPDIDWGFEYPVESSELQCPICRDYYVKPVQHSCGHSFCEGCIRRYMTSTGPFRGTLTCPVCRTVWKHERFKPNIRLAQAVSRLQIICRVCQQSLLYSSRAQHRSGCPGSRTSSEPVHRCEFCGLGLENDPSARAVHWSVCSKTNLISCCYCGNSVHRSYLYEHEQACRRGHYASLGSGTQTTTAVESPWLTVGLIVLGVVTVAVLSLFGLRR
ncbi:Tripartite motif-containing protein 12A [Clonorchis sinensis]|uniref:Tripartite motif-containing protein 12A n=1 Tax=Clonorchis sinensis TaxID=79923 RepID=A0A8T1MHY6_CLOSI|nr:Tripartite motif-containing protein 12A [Clonorchis sinensis]